MIALASTGVSGYNIVIQKKHIKLLCELYEEAEKEEKNFRIISNKLLKECEELKRTF